MSTVNKLEPRHSDINALLGKGSEFEGKLTFEGTVQIDGKFSGEIFSDGALILGEGAKVKAEISVDTLILNGELIGNVKAKSAIELNETSKLKGNIISPSLSVQKGAIFDGNCTMEGEIKISASKQTVSKISDDIPTSPIFPLK